MMEEVLFQRTGIETDGQFLQVPHDKTVDCYHAASQGIKGIPADSVNQNETYARMQWDMS